VPVQQRGDLHAFQLCQQERHVIDSFNLESLKDLVYHASILNRPTNPERRKKVSERQEHGVGWSAAALDGQGYWYINTLAAEGAHGKPIKAVGYNPGREQGAIMGPFPIPDASV